MKKLFTLAAVALLSVLATAQENQGLKGTWWATAQLGYQQTKTGDVKSTNLTVLPLVGYFVAPTTTVGVGAGYINIKAEDATGTTTADSGLFVVEPLVRKYYGITSNLFFFGQIAAPMVFGKEDQSDLKVSQFGLAASGGLDFILSKSITVEFSYNLANLSFTTLKPTTGDKTTVTDFSVAHIANVDSSYVSALGGSGSGLVTPLSFGFKFLF